MARFDQVKEEEAKKEEEESLFGDSESDTDSDASGDGAEVAIDGNGSRMKDGKGRGMFKVCDGEDQNDPDVKREREELRDLDDSDGSNDHDSGAPPQGPNPTLSSDNGPAVPPLSRTTDPPNPSSIGLYDIPQYIEKEDAPATPRPKINIQKRPIPASRNSGARSKSPFNKSLSATNLSQNSLHAHKRSSPQPSLPSSPIRDLICPICSMSNEAGSILCIACSHVLDTAKVTRYWRCDKEACQASEYINAADCGRCGVCGSRRSDRDGGSGSGVDRNGMDGFDAWEEG